MQKIVPSLWFDKETEAAIDFYTALFPDSKIVSIKRYPDPVPVDFMKGMEGKVLTAIFELAGHKFMALDGGPIFKINPSISFFVQCATKDEVNELWGKLSARGKTLMPLDEYPFNKWYGWVQDRYGVSWQLLLTDGAMQQKIIPSLMFVGTQAGKAEEAINFYAQVFKDAKVGEIARYGEGQAPDKAGTVAYADVTLAGQKFAAMDSAREHEFTFSEAISLYVECQDQAEVDYFWEKLSAVPASEQCGWLKDKYGVSWQIIPKQMGELLSDPDQQRADRVMKAMLKMKKIDVEGLERAADQT